MKYPIEMTCSGNQWSRTIAYRATFSNKKDLDSAISNHVRVCKGRITLKVLVNKK